jgi:hypothetical protein
MSSSVIIPPININFIGRGLEGIRKLKNAQQLLVESPDAKDLLVLSPQANKNISPLLGFFAPQAPAAPKPANTRNKRKLPSLLINMKTKDVISIKNQVPPNVVPSPPNYKNKLLESDKQLVVSSVNCAFKIVDGFFYKIQISARADPLINEVIFTRILSKASSDIHIFPKYVDHFTIEGEKLFEENRKIIDFGYKNYKVLVTESINAAASLSSVLKATDKTNKHEIVAKIEALMTAYKYYGETLNFIHGDLHMSNIQIENGDTYIKSSSPDNIKNLNPKIIDFGRCFVRDEDTIKNKKTFTIGLGEEIQFKDDFAKFNIPETIDFENEWRLVNMKLENCGYLCDVAQVAFNLLLSGAIKNNKEWFKISTYDAGKREFVHIDFKKIQTLSKQNLTILDHGFIWLSCYLYACKTEIYNNIYIGRSFFSPDGFRRQDMNTVLGQTVLLSDKGDIIQFDLNRLMNNTLLVKNGMFNPSVFSDDDFVQAMTYFKYSRIFPENFPVKGGSNKNLITLTKKERRHRRQYINQMSSETSAESSAIFQHTLKTHEPLNSTVLPTDDTPEYYTPLPSSEIDLDNLDKSITQIFFEEIQKNKTFRSEFVVEEFENRDVVVANRDVAVANRDAAVANRDVNRDVAIANRDAAATSASSCVPCSNNEIFLDRLKNLSIAASLGVGIPWAESRSSCCPTVSGRIATRGGSASSHKDYKIYVCAETTRKYIRKSNERWYLDENRGKYRYSDEKKTKISMR